MVSKRNSASDYIYLKINVILFLMILSAGQQVWGMTIEKRIECTKAIEEVYWSHRIWPENNSGPKIPLNQMMPDEMIRAKVEDMLRKSNALESYFKKPITGELIQAEIERIAKNTRQPSVLKEIWAALDNNPRMIAECLVRPMLTERMILEEYKQIANCKSDIKRKEFTKTESFEEWWENNKSRFGIELVEPAYNYQLPQNIDFLCTDDSWAATFVPVNPRKYHTAVWTGTEMIVWGGENNSHSLNDGSRYDPTTDSWTSMTLTGAPAGRWNQTAVWTGTEMIVWGGTNESGNVNSGGKYNPQLNQWTATTTTNAASAREYHTAAWTGSVMIIWGGVSGNSTYLNTGSRYNPVSDSWLATSTTGAPSIRGYHTAVWNGSVMIIWGGYYYDFGDHSLNTGGRYSPASDSWSDTTTVNVPSAAAFHSAVWTGSEMIVWGGRNDSSIYINTGARYNPALNTWTGVTSTTNAPVARGFHSVVWTGTEMIIWGGIYGTNTGGRYNPTTNIWAATSTTNVPGSQHYPIAIWTGTEMIIWGGHTYSGDDNEGSRYNPVSDTWVATSLMNVPTPRYYNTSIWTGAEMIVWGGMGLINDLALPVNTGAKYILATDNWTPVTTTNAPSARWHHTAVWTGTEMIIWAGSYYNYGNSTYYNTGGRYNPVTDSWIATPTTGAPNARESHSAVWTGTEMIVWGGDEGSSGGGYVNTGGRYSIATNSWTPTTWFGAPVARAFHTAVWTGSQMIMWGGRDGSIYYNSGARYYPSYDSWAWTTTSGAPEPRYHHSAVWTGTEMVVWGGSSYIPSFHVWDTGGKYNPDANTWTPTSLTNVPTAREYHSAVWTGSDMIIWGGSYTDTSDHFLNTGSRYNPATDAWIAISTSNAPIERRQNTAVWTDSEMIVWGGYNAGWTNTGGKYCSSFLKLQLYQGKKPQVDDTGSTTANGIIEPNEQVVLRGHLQNIGTISASNTTAVLTTPNQIVITQPNAVYGTIPPGGNMACSTCYGMYAPAGNRLSTHWDFQLKETVAVNGYNPFVFDYLYHVGKSFSDVSTSNVFYSYIETLLHTGVATGCTTTTYCPAANVQRQHMAKFICVSMNSSSPGSCVSASCTGIFADVPSSNAFCPYIEALYSGGVVSGCQSNPTLLYCPADVTQRQAMAKFVCKAMEKAHSGSCVTSACAGIFTDVGSSNPFCGYIEALYNASILSGCGPSLFCPAANVARDQMAKFIVNAFNFAL